MILLMGVAKIKETVQKGSQSSRLALDLEHYNRVILLFAYVVLAPLAQTLAEVDLPVVVTSISRDN